MEGIAPLCTGGGGEGEGNNGWRTCRLLVDDWCTNVSHASQKRSAQLVHNIVAAARSHVSHAARGRLAWAPVVVIGGGREMEGGVVIAVVGMA